MSKQTSHCLELAIIGSALLLILTSLVLWNMTPAFSQSGDPYCEECLGGDNWEPLQNIIGGAECAHGPAFCGLGDVTYYVPKYIGANNNILDDIVLEPDAACCETSAGKTRYIWTGFDNDGFWAANELTLVTIPSCDDDFACRCLVHHGSWGCRFVERDMLRLI